MHGSLNLSRVRHAPARITSLSATELPHVTLSDPAQRVMTDFAHAHPVTITEERRIDDALADMIRFGVRALLVVAGGQVSGLITSYDIQGERPLQFLRSSTYTRHDQILVGHIMTPWEKVPRIEWESVLEASVEDVLELFAATGATHLVVLETGAEGATVVRGLISRTRLERQLGSA
jgi:CBS domain-containing protein